MGQEIKAAIPPVTAPIPTLKKDNSSMRTV